ncbi:hypothetical protein TVAG_019540 [Trichomonas vaginalis G3]|uniref:Uncharacterized protein n=1 Tax=Trichomonas vaginalis (strain ATCC PRA-98 / G3) TaxID=412133 RepID=A2DX27_TRIV3|nr:hypothetical protein TVAGG3_0185250 [Trichomonas vaginalis G3]EAY15054.1 hypothetical protein TVAG_019540 [Trichomonas vaginalis G3]KAI5549595.1 hypothetical protein TVAGG3_0185250 [Trichomonas vaginalis G3]|eukprot:XP_001327277.1 hypothetical protein [Trichomonas vaginalis G3]
MDEEHGLFAVMLASSLEQCSVRYGSGLKVFPLFHNSAMTVQVHEGIGIIDPLTQLTPTFNEDTDDYEELYEISDESIPDDIDELVLEDSLHVFNHIKRLVSLLYGTDVSHLEIAFGLKDIGDEIQIFITDVLSCKLQKSPLSDLLANVPDGSDMFAQLLTILYSCNYSTDHCWSIPRCDKHSEITVTLGVTLRYFIFQLFYDCNVDLLFNFAKNFFREFSPESLRKTVRFCRDCYFKWQLEEMKFKQLGKYHYQTAPVTKGPKDKAQLRAAAGNVLRNGKMRASVGSSELLHATYNNKKNSVYNSRNEGFSFSLLGKKRI